MAKVAAGKMKGAISKSSLVGSGGDSYVLFFFFLPGFWAVVFVHLLMSQ